MSRFDGELDQNSAINLNTIIVIDQLGKKSITKEISGQLGVRIFEMSSSNWLIKLDNSISKISGEYNKTFEKHAGVEDIRSIANEKITKRSLELILDE